MEHHVARDLLAAYVEDDLEAGTKTEVEQHLEGCDECRALLEKAGTPVDLAAAVADGTPLWDEKRMRKTVRRTLLRVVFKSISIWIIGFVVLAAVSAFAFQPLVIDRGDRARRAGIATWDLPVLVTPGASVDRWTTDATLFGRDLTVELVRFVGSEPQPLGSFETDLGVFSFSQRGLNAVNPSVASHSARDWRSELQRLTGPETSPVEGNDQSPIPDPCRCTIR